jgi:hypothetical protein
MKNKYFDYMRAKAKKYAKTWHRANQLTPLGNALIHCYDNPDNKKEHGWWDDVQFKLGGQVITVWWIHPRMAFSDTTDTVAYDSLPPAPEWNWASSGVKNYKKIGKNKNRKRLVSTTIPPSPASFTEWCDLWKVRRAEVRQSTDIVIRPSIKVDQLSWCRGVSLCIPIEAVDADSVEQVAEIAKKLLRGETTLDELFPNYTYTKDDWAAEAQSNWNMT